MQKLFLLFATFLSCLHNYAQCSFNPVLSASDKCAGASLTVTIPSSAATQIIWKKDGATIKTVNATKQPPTSGTTVAGDIFPGSSLSRLNFPSGISVDNNQNVFIADYYNNRVVKWAPEATQGIVVAGGNGSGAAAD